MIGAMVAGFGAVALICLPFQSWAKSHVSSDNGRDESARTDGDVAITKGARARSDD